ncbi:MAG TPA: hypothetical protein ENG22_02645 [Candidatus Bathyarchaeota archaeon]|nr:hypothetical protein [Candidatus Bathyarchaeota archaeon]
MTESIRLGEIALEEVPTKGTLAYDFLVHKFKAEPNFSWVGFQVHVPKGYKLVTASSDRISAYFEFQDIQDSFLRKGFYIKWNALHESQVSVEWLFKAIRRYEKYIRHRYGRTVEIRERYYIEFNGHECFFYHSAFPLYKKKGMFRHEQQLLKSIDLVWLCRDLNRAYTVSIYADETLFSRNVKRFFSILKSIKCHYEGDFNTLKLFDMSLFIPDNYAIIGASEANENEGVLNIGVPSEKKLLSIEWAPTRKILRTLKCKSFKEVPEKMKKSFLDLSTKRKEKLSLKHLSDSINRHPAHIFEMHLERGRFFKSVKSSAMIIWHCNKSNRVFTVLANAPSKLMPLYVKEALRISKRTLCHRI